MAWWVLVGGLVLLVACTTQEGWRVAETEQVLQACSNLVWVEMNRAPTNEECAALVFELRDAGCSPDDTVRWLHIKASGVEPREPKAAFCNPGPQPPTLVA